MRSSLVPIVALLACGGSSGSASTSEPEPGGSEPADASAGSDAPALREPASKAEGAERLLELFATLTSRMTEHVENRGTDCQSFTKTLATWLKTHGDELRDLLILDHADEDHERIDASITEAATVVVFGAAECGDADDAMTAYNEWDALVL